MSFAFLARAALREARGARGRLLFFTACLALGSFAVVGVAGLVGSVRAALALQSRELLGGDVWIRSRAPLPEALTRALEEERARGAHTLAVRLVQTMLRSTQSGASRLVELKAVEPGFPFAGALTLEPPGTLDACLSDERVAVAAELAGALGLAPGDEVGLGAARFTVAALVRDEPGRLDPTFTAGPRVFATLAGFERMQLGGVGSRITYGELVALPARVASAADWAEALDQRLELQDVRFESHEEAQPQVRRAAARVERYLGLVALLSLLLGGVGVAEIVRAWIGARVGSVAVLRVLGASAREIMLAYAGNVALLALVGTSVGALLGSFLPLLVPRLLPELLPSGLELAWEPLAMLRGIGLGTLVALAFSLPALVTIGQVAPVRVLRHDAEPLPTRPALARLAAAFLLAVVFLTAWVQSERVLEAGVFTGGLVVLLGGLALGARLLTRLAALVPRARLPATLAHATAALARPGAGVLGAVAALGLGTLVVVTLLLVESRLRTRLESSLPRDAPSLFFLDLQPEQRAEFERVLTEEEARSVRIVPMASARLRSIDGVDVEELAGQRDDTRGRGRWALTREQRLTWQAEFGPDNRIVAGTPWSDPQAAEVSLEVDYAEDIGAALGARLVFDLSGVPVELVVTSLREVEWESFGINFFLVAEPGVLDDAPHSLLAAADVAPERAQRVQDRLAAVVPNVTVINVRAILAKVGVVLARSGAAVQGLGGFTVLVGLVILAGVAALGALRRAREAALWKVLGVTRAGIARLFALEFALVGALAGLLGSAGACVLAWAFFEHVLEFESELPWWTVPASSVVTGGLAAFFGLLACARALTVRPLESLRG